MTGLINLFSARQVKTRGCIDGLKESSYLRVFFKTRRYKYVFLKTRPYEDGFS